MAEKKKERKPGYHCVRVSVSVSVVYKFKFNKEKLIFSILPLV